MTNTKPRLTNRAIQAVKKSLSAKNRMQFELEISYLTVQRWLKENNERLTTVRVLNIISEETGLSKTDILEN